MARQLLQQCRDCQTWTLLRICPKCEGDASAAAPLKWSPEDQRANIRRKMYDVESSKWLESLPALESIESLRESTQEEE
tara:strand:+ start:4139 stop:4375 length:237 start_codon:yes stop_codon:yes gene_type:complete